MIVGTSTFVHQQQSSCHNNLSSTSQQSHLNKSSLVVASIYSDHILGNLSALQNIQINPIAKMSDETKVTTTTSAEEAAQVMDKGKGKAPAEDMSMEDDDSSSDEDEQVSQTSDSSCCRTHHTFDCTS